MAGKRKSPPASQADTSADQASVMPVAVVAAETVREGLAAVMLGMSGGAIRAARRDGRWAEGVHWHRAPDGTIWIDIPAVQDWIRGPG